MTMRYQHWFRLLVSAWMVGGVASVGRADLIISIGSGLLTQGGTSSIDVTIESTSALDRLTDYIIGFALTTANGREIWFVDPQPESHLADPNYVFASGSLSKTGPPSGNVSSSRLEFVTSDVSDEPQGVSGPFSRLLARLDLTALTSLPPQAGDVFTINLVEADTAFGYLDPDTFDYTELNYTWSPGQVTVTQAVPEPSSLLLTAAAAGAAVVVRRRRRRQLARG
jgi:hypothetical protein